MKRKVTLFLAMLLMTIATRTYAAFPTTRTTEKEIPAVVVETHKSFIERKVPAFLSHLLPAPDHAKKESATDKIGWEGIASLVCGVIGLFIVPILFSTAAVVFGFMGLNGKKHKNTGLAIAGLILGGVGVIYYLAVMAR